MRERKPIDGALRRYLDEQAAAAGRAGQMTDEARVGMVRSLMMQTLESRQCIPGLPNTVESRDLKLNQSLGVRLYTPPRRSETVHEELRPVLVYLHGGGWAAGSVATVDPFCRLLSEAAGVIIVSVEYRLAPEHPYPAALDDTLAAVKWAARTAQDWGGDAERLGLGGDSAGANLAAVTAHRICAGTETCGLGALLLLYPVTDHPSAGHPSFTENATGFGLEANSMRWFWELYARGASPHDPGISPLRIEKVPPLPPTLVTTAEYDVLRDEGVAYAERLEEAGVAVTHLHAGDMHHNFPVSPGTVGRFPQSEAAVAQIAGWLKAILRSESCASELQIQVE